MIGGGDRRNRANRPLLATAYSRAGTAAVGFCASGVSFCFREPLALWCSNCIRARHRVPSLPPETRELSSDRGLFVLSGMSSMLPRQSHGLPVVMLLPLRYQAVDEPRYSGSNGLRTADPPRRMGLRQGGDVLLNREMDQERATFGHVHLAGMMLVMKEHIAPGPTDVGLLGAPGLVSDPQ
jgi:hypothetical protein